MTDGIQSIFAQMRKTRESSINESATVEKPVVTEPINESTVTESTVTDSNVETTHLDEAEEFIIIGCHDCGAILSALDEAEDGCPVCGSYDLDEKTVKVVKEGKVVTKNVSTKKRKLSPAQKAALAKARKKAHSGAANKKRAKSNAVRAKKGMNEADSITCPECGYEGDIDEFLSRFKDLVCPECGAQIEDDED